MDNTLKPTPSFTAAQINKEEWINSITHGIGVIASIVGLVFLLRPFGETLTLAQWGSYAIYGSSLILLFLASSIYHGVQKQRLKRIFKMVDHCAIYLLIAGSYTPLLLLTIGGELAYIVLWVIWSVAVVGILFKLKFGSRFEKLSLMTYLGMGWCSIFIIYELWQKLPAGGFALLIAGGLTYSLGTVFYANEKIPYNHAIWHLFVLGGASCHYFMVLFYVPVL
ncbi:MAG: hemolysin III family protein [Algicola sp.]|nr:hemolysin III family protein [Algicola sp.]